jgi:hypothetical protein
MCPAGGGRLKPWRWASSQVFEARVLRVTSMTPGNGMM